ncbi:MAG: endonuclease/exonuclease/phosphatase family protein [Bacteroidaceae bacterium]|nr:endonuclease/exonuclease/phosphatase family protein [Bacteroidaceae bacterium]
MTTKRKKTSGKGTDGVWASLFWWCATLSASLLSLCGLSTFVTPLRFPLLSVLALGFPLFLAMTIVSLLPALVLRTRKWWVPLLILLGNVWAVRIYLPVNLPPDEQTEGLKVLSYNVQNFYVVRDDTTYGASIVKYILESEADIVCLQEAPRNERRFFREVWSALRDTYSYRDSLEMPSSSYLNIYSRLPIIGRELVADAGSNQCMAFTLLDGKDTLYVVNCHLCSTRLSPEEKQSFSGMVHDADTLTAGDRKRESVTLLTKISAAGVERAAQTDALCEYLERMRGKRVILCGDFNDTPISYTHNRISSYLTDCYAAVGSGFGRSFNAHSMPIRIDHMFCSPHYKPLACRIDQSVLLSDHYPVLCTLARRE